MTRKMKECELKAEFYKKLKLSFKLIGLSVLNTEVSEKVHWKKDFRINNKWQSIHDVPGYFHYSYF